MRTKNIKFIINFLAFSNNFFLKSLKTWKLIKFTEFYLKNNLATEIIYLNLLLRLSKNI